MIMPLCETKVDDISIIREIKNTPLALRLCELGFNSGSEVKTLFNCSGSCAAYLVKGTVIALRHEDARNINVSLRK